VAAELIRIYDLRDQHELIAQMQETSLTRDDLGLAANPLVGSDEWWSIVEAGGLGHRIIEGEVTRSYWGGMADWPEFELTDDAGDRTTWTREGDARRYVEGLRARVEFVEHPWENPDAMLGETSRVKVGLWVEESDKRAAGIAPGPGGAGYQLARKHHGSAAHYLLLPDRGRAGQFARDLEGRGRVVRVRGGGTAGHWIVEVWAPSAEQARAEVADLAAEVARIGGSYDGGEIVEGKVWGPEAS
jgi:hypothetical protein